MTENPYAHVYIVIGTLDPDYEPVSIVFGVTDSYDKAVVIRDNAIQFAIDAANAENPTEEMDDTFLGYSEYADRISINTYGPEPVQ